MTSACVRRYMTDDHPCASKPADRDLDAVMTSAISTIQVAASGASRRSTRPPRVKRTDGQQTKIHNATTIGAPTIVSLVPMPSAQAPAAAQIQAPFRKSVSAALIAQYSVAR